MFDLSDTVICDGDKIIVVDSEGLELWKKYRWRYNLSVGHLYRYERRIVNGKIARKTILFWVELLGFPKGQNVYFLNGNRLDLRRRNLVNPRYMGYGEYSHWL